jgi:hypothetical protein
VSGSSIYVATNGSGVFLSTNNGAKWVISGLANYSVWSLAVSGNNIFAGTYGGIFLSANNGSSWTAVNSGLTTRNTYCLTTSGDNIFAGTNGGGVFLSSNGGTNWTSVNSGLTDTVIFSLAVSGSNVFAGTYGHGVWRRPISEMVGVIHSKPLTGLPHQAHFKILSPGTNKTTATIVLNLPHSEKVKLTVYTASGNEIASFTNNYLESGFHSVIWDTRNVAAGFYTIRMQAGPDSFAKKFTVIR